MRLSHRDWQDLVDLATKDLSITSNRGDAATLVNALHLRLWGQRPLDTVPLKFAADEMPEVQEALWAILYPITNGEPLILRTPRRYAYSRFGDGSYVGNPHGTPAENFTAEFAPHLLQNADKIRRCAAPDCDRFIFAWRGDRRFCGDVSTCRSKERRARQAGTGIAR